MIDGMSGTRRRTPFHMVRIVRQVPSTIPASRTGRVMPVRPVPAAVRVSVMTGPYLRLPRAGAGAV